MSSNGEDHGAESRGREQTERLDTALDAVRREPFELGADVKDRIARRLDSEHRPQFALAHSPRMRLAALMVVMVVLTGAGLAAAGGIDTITRWLNLDIGGKRIDVPLDSDGKASFVTDTERGGRARVDVEHTELPDGDRTRVRVHERHGPLGTQLEISDDVRERRGDDLVAEPIRVASRDHSETARDCASSLELRDAARLDIWRTTTGMTGELLYLDIGDVTGAATGDDSRAGAIAGLYLRTSADSFGERIERLPDPPAWFDAERVSVDVGIGTHGSLTIEIHDGGTRQWTIQVVTDGKNERTLEIDEETKQ